MADSTAHEDTNIKVAVRCRPFNTKEKNNNEGSCVRITSSQITLTNPDVPSEEHSFGFDILFDQDSRQEEVWEQIGDPILMKAFSGFNGTIFAYGQTGSGKTWSMQGGDGELRGIIPRMNSSLFTKVESEKQCRPTLDFLVTASYFEIYNEVIFDLLDPTDRKKKPASAKGGLEIKEHPVLGVYVKGLQEIVVDNAAKLQSLIDQGMKNRTVAATNMNADSSRSHSIFTITVHQKDTTDESKNVFAKINLVDLAGSERAKSTGASGATLKEGANINKSLSALGNVINALVEVSKGKSTFIPYRNSKLTRVLQESLGGNSITAMLAALSPAGCNFEETLSTLKYANRAKAIKVKAVKNEEASQISKLNDEIRLLKEKLAQQGPSQSNNTSDMSAFDEKHRQQLLELEAATRSTWEAKAKLSEEHEQQRLKLEVEQKAAQRRLQVSREQQWKLLTEKGDLELSIAHVKSLIKGSPSQEFYSVSEKDVRTVPNQLGLWQAKLREVTRLQQVLSEQDTVVQVYRSALERDASQLVRASSSNSSAPGYSSSSNTPMKGSISPRMDLEGRLSTLSGDKSSLSIWRQLGDKCNTTRSEVMRWTELQDNLRKTIFEFFKDVEKYSEVYRRVSNELIVRNFGDDGNTNTFANIDENSEMANMLSAEDNNEIIRGLNLIRKQLKDKFVSSCENIYKNRLNMTSFGQLSNDLQLHLSKYNTIFDELLSTMSTSQIDSATQQSIQALSESQRRLANDSMTTFDNVRKIFADLSQVLDSHQAKSTAVGSNSEMANRNVSAIGNATETVVPLKIDYSSGSTLEGSNITVESDHCWRSGSLHSESESPFLEFVLAEAKPIVALRLRPGFVEVESDTKTSSNTDSSAADESTVTDDLVKPTSLANFPHDIKTFRKTLFGAEFSYNADESNSETIAKMKFADCIRGDSYVTTQIFNTLLGETSPLATAKVQKSLSRPPVRLCFDLVLKVVEVAPKMFATDLLEATWDKYGASKQTKIDFMQLVIDFVSDLSGEPPVTSANNIVTGNEADLTNALLQKLSFIAYVFTYYKDKSKSEKKSKKTRIVKQINKIESIPTKISVSMSLDGITWDRTVNVEVVYDNNNNNIADIKLPLNEGIECKFLRMAFTEWRVGNNIYSLQSLRQHTGGSNTSISGPAARVSLVATCSMETNVHGDIPDNLTVCKDIRGDIVANVLAILNELIRLMICAIDIIGKIEDVHRGRKQEEAKKRMEALAFEKIELEKLLQNEKQAMHNEKLDLTEQLKVALNNLSELQRAFEMEKLRRIQLENDMINLESEKNDISSTLQHSIDENSLLKSQLLNFQTIIERDKIMIERNEKIALENEAKILELQNLTEDLQTKKSQFESEKDDFVNQILILTEERELSRAKEEELYESLSEKTCDLERLQESYVDLADRCNEAQDELCELREQLEAMQELRENSTERYDHSSSSDNRRNVVDRNDNISSSNGNNNNTVKSTIQSQNTVTKSKIEETNKSSKSIVSMSDTRNDYEDDFDDYEDEFEAED